MTDENKFKTLIITISWIEAVLFGVIMSGCLYLAITTTNSTGIISWGYYSGVIVSGFFLFTCFFLILGVVSKWIYRIKI